MNTKPIDIVIPYVNPNDKIWQASFKYWTKRERGITANNRFRDLNSLVYVLRSIDKNCKWVNKVFLILASKTQIPSWLNTNNPKLKIVYHEDYIPKHLLPTFNSNTILMHLHLIDELADNFILANDDTFFMSNIEDTFYFNNDIPNGQLTVERYGLRDAANNYFIAELNNNAKLISKTTGSAIFLKHYHFPLANNKTFWKFCWYKFNAELSKSFSKFRTAKNYTDWFFHDLGLLTHKINDVLGMYNNCKFICCTDTPNFRQFDNAKLACFNDDMSDRAYERVKKQFNAYMKKRFSKKSSFEK